MLIKQFIAGQLENNMYLVADEASKRAVLIDASSNIPELIEFAKDYDVEYILWTSGKCSSWSGSTSSGGGTTVCHKLSDGSQSANYEELRNKQFKRNAYLNV